MRIVITKCDEPDAWYANQKGKVFEVYSERSDCYYVDESRYVLKEDCEEYRGGLRDPDGGDYPLKWMSRPKGDDATE
jgi:hypothetical protein